MNITPVNNINFNNYQYNNKPQYLANNSTKSKLFAPIAKKYDKLTDWLAENYFAKFSVSKFAEKFAQKTKNVKNMTTHMSALGATLISGMYVIRTLKNDNLDKQKRKTLAINDGLTWGLSTAGSYFLDAKLANWWENVTTRFAANYLTLHPESKNIELLGNWNPENIKEIIKTGGQKALDKYAEMKSKLSPEELDVWMKKVNFKEKGFEQLKEYIDDNKCYKNIKEFNVDILKDKNLDKKIEGMGVLKTLLIFGMIYRYVVPVLVMKPANKIGAYIHKKNAEKNANKTVNA